MNKPSCQHTCIDEEKGLLATLPDLVLLLQGKHPRVERDPHSEPGVLGEGEARGGTSERVTTDGGTGKDIHFKAYF